MELHFSTESDANDLIDVREVDRNTLEPILFLLQSPDIEVQRAASAALGNLAVNGKPSRSRLGLRYISDTQQPRTKFSLSNLEASRPLSAK
jgi:vacuolar protein 8